VTIVRSLVNLKMSNQRWGWRRKIRRGLWAVCWLLLFRPTPKRMGSAWRQWLLRRFGAVIHGDALVLPSCRILQPWELELNDGVAIGARAELYNYARIKIGRMSLVSQDTYLCTGTHDHTHRHMPLTWAPITVGAECWIAAGAFVGPGVDIGDGAVIGARSVVTKSMPRWMICAGNPCRPLKPRVIAG
jgi:putative colanic acid biosynthesis acetyltransferase WcaF